MESESDVIYILFGYSDNKHQGTYCSDEVHYLSTDMQLYAIFFRFEIDDLEGDPLTESQMLTLHYDTVLNLQKQCFAHFKVAVVALCSQQGGGDLVCSGAVGDLVIQKRLYSLINSARLGE